MKSLAEIIIEKELKGTPMEGAAQHFISAGIKYKIDPLFLVAIGYHESHLGKAYSSDHNNIRHSYAGVMSWSQGARELKAYDNWEDAIYDHARIMRELYFNHGLNTIAKIWQKYAPVGWPDGNFGWGFGVANKYKQLKTYETI